MYGTSTENSEAVEIKDSVRAHIYTWNWIFAPIKGEPNKNNAIYMIQSDAKGNIPKYISNTFSKDQALSVAGLRKVAANKMMN